MPGRQTFNPYTVYQSGIGYYSGGIQKFGGLGLKYFRTSQIRLTFGDLQLAFLSPDTSKNPDPIIAKVDGYGKKTGNTKGTFKDTDTALPSIEARYSLKLDPVTVDFMGGWQTFEVEDNSGHKEDVDPYVLDVKAATNFGPLYMKGLLRYAQNGGN